MHRMYEPECNDPYITAYPAPAATAVLGAVRRVCLPPRAVQAGKGSHLEIPGCPPDALRSLPVPLRCPPHLSLPPSVFRGWLAQRRVLQRMTLHAWFRNYAHPFLCVIQEADSHVLLLTDYIVLSLPHIMLWKSSDAVFRSAKPSFCRDQPALPSGGQPGQGAISKRMRSVPSSTPPCTLSLALAHRSAVRPGCGGYKVPLDRPGLPTSPRLLRRARLPAAPSKVWQLSSRLHAIFEAALASPCLPPCPSLSQTERPPQQRRPKAAASPHRCNASGRRPPEPISQHAWLLRGPPAADDGARPERHTPGPAHCPLNDLPRVLPTVPSTTS